MMKCSSKQPDNNVWQPIWESVVIRAVTVDGLMDCMMDKR